jgi:hypothetical protein
MVVYHCYHHAGWPATLLAIVSAGVLAVRKERLPAKLTTLAVVLGLLGGATALIVIVALVDVTSFSALHAMYLAPATPLVLATWILAPYWALGGKSAPVLKRGLARR